jgi:hypothetical protein
VSKCINTQDKVWLDAMALQYSSLITIHTNTISIRYSFISAANPCHDHFLLSSFDLVPSAKLTFRLFFFSLPAIAGLLGINLLQLP